MTAATSTGGSSQSMATGGPHRRQQGQRVELAVDGEGLAGAEGVEDVLDGSDVFAQAWAGRVELGAVTALDVGPDLRAQPQAEAPVGGLGQLPRRRRGDHRAAREGHGDAGEDVDVVGGDGQRGAREVGRATGFGDHEPRQAGFRGQASELADLSQGLRRQHGVEGQAGVGQCRHRRRSRRRRRRRGVASTVTVGVPRTPPRRRRPRPPRGSGPPARARSAPRATASGRSRSRPTARALGRGSAAPTP